LGNKDGDEDKDKEYSDWIAQKWNI
jgi:hypothetical protein